MYLALSGETGPLTSGQELVYIQCCGRSGAGLHPVLWKVRGLTISQSAGVHINLLPSLFLS